MSQLAWELVVDRCGELEGTVAAHGSLLAELSELRFEREQIKQLKATVELQQSTITYLKQSNRELAVLAREGQKHWQQTRMKLVALSTQMFHYEKTIAAMVLSNQRAAASSIASELVAAPEVNDKDIEDDIEDAKESPQPLDASTIADEQDSDPDDDTISVSSWQKLEVSKCLLLQIFKCFVAWLSADTLIIVLTFS